MLLQVFRPWHFLQDCSRVALTQELQLVTPNGMPGYRSPQKKARAQNREFRVFGIRGSEQSSFVELAYPKP